MVVVLTFLRLGHRPNINLRLGPGLKHNYVLVRGLGRVADKITAHDCTALAFCLASFVWVGLGLGIWVGQTGFQTELRPRHNSRHSFSLGPLYLKHKAETLLSWAVIDLKQQVGSLRETKA